MDLTLLILVSVLAEAATMEVDNSCHVNFDKLWTKKCVDDYGNKYKKGSKNSIHANCTTCTCVMEGKKLHWIEEDNNQCCNDGGNYYQYGCIVSSENYVGDHGQHHCQGLQYWQLVPTHLALSLFSWEVWVVTVLGDRLADSNKSILCWIWWLSLLLVYWYLWEWTLGRKWGLYPRPFGEQAMLLWRGVLFYLVWSLFSYCQEILTGVTPGPWMVHLPGLNIGPLGVLHPPRLLSQPQNGSMVDDPGLQML